jgi:hypothetical protein
MPPATWPVTEAVIFFVMPFGLTNVPASSLAPRVFEASSANAVSSLWGQATDRN